MNYNPYPIIKDIDRFARRGWWNGLETAHAVSLSTTAGLRPSLGRLPGDSWRLLAAVCQAASAALSLHPKLNYFTFWGKLCWAGPQPRVQVFLEEPELSCCSVVLSSAHEMRPGQVQEFLRCNGLQRPATGWELLRERWPMPGYLLERFSGALKRRYKKENAPLFISMLGLEGIEDLRFAPAHSMALYPGWPVNGRLPLTLCYNHQLANARPVGRFLLTIRDLLQ